MAIVGGGAIGCSVAYHGALRGARAVLLEAERLGSGSPGALAGRPGAPTGPMLGPVEGWEGLLLATGHSRNGVLFSAAITGEAVSTLALDEGPPVDVAPFSARVTADQGVR